jgi:IS30 family transposase
MYAADLQSCGPSPGGCRSLMAKTGGVRPLVLTEWSGARLSLAEREEISRGIAGELSARQIAAGLGQAPSTISREIACPSPTDCAPTTDAARPRRRPACAPCVPNRSGAASSGQWSRPNWKSTGHPNRSPTGCRRHSPTIRRCVCVSHETIYVSPLSGDGGLCHELFRNLPQGQAIRRPQG